MSRLSIKDQVYLAISFRGTSLSAIAREMGTTQQNLFRKIVRNTLKKEDLCKIAKALDGEYMSYFSFPGDIIIGDRKEGRKGTSAFKEEPKEMGSRDYSNK